jgi:hypothetical protein
MDIKGRLHGFHSRGSNSDRFLSEGTPKGPCLCRPAKTMQDLVERHQTAMQNVDANMIRRDRDTAVRGNDVCLEVEGGPLENPIITMSRQ